MFFYRVAPPPPVIGVEESFEYAAGWPGTINTNFELSTPSALVEEDFETSQGWPT